jgi:hypothetical protein
MPLFWVLRNTSTSFKRWLSPFDSTLLSSVRELFYQFKLGGDENHGRALFFNLFGQDISKRVKDPYINLSNVCSCVLFAEIFGVSILFLIA